MKFCFILFYDESDPVTYKTTSTIITITTTTITTIITTTIATTNNSIS